jgi:hypothetical protein
VRTGTPTGHPAFDGDEQDVPRIATSRIVDGDAMRGRRVDGEPEQQRGWASMEVPPEAEHGRTHSTTLTVAATFDSLGLVRVVVGGVAAHSDMTVDATEDLCLAVDEACLLLLEAFAPAAPGRDDRLQLEFEPHPDAGCVAVVVRRPGAAACGPSSEVTTLVLDALTSAWSLDLAGSAPCVSLTVDTGSR